MFTYPFTRNLNITTLRGRPLKDFLSTLIQDVNFSQETHIKSIL